MKNILRRSFIRKFGAGASAALATTAGLGMARAEANTPEDDPAHRVALLEEEKTLRKLHRAFEQAIHNGLHEEVIAMFAEDAEVLFNGGVFKGRSRGVSRLFRDRFPAGKIGRRMEPAPGFELTAEQLRETVEVSPDLHSAKAVFPYSIQVGVPFETESSLAAMARPAMAKAFERGGKAVSIESIIGRTSRVNGRFHVSNTTRCLAPTIVREKAMLCRSLCRIFHMLSGRSAGPRRKREPRPAIVLT
jgi:hypothetical protein